MGTAHVVFDFASPLVVAMCGALIRLMRKRMARTFLLERKVAIIERAFIRAGFERQLIAEQRLAAFDPTF